jgi:mycofactocin system glycosyltransferase
VTPLPEGLRLALDPAVRIYGGGRVLVAAGRIIRLSAAGPAALRALLAGEATLAQRRLGRRLVDAGMAHPRPSPRAASATVVIPVRDRPAELARCLAAMGGGVAVVVVDDGSADAAAIADACRRRGARLVRHEQSGGPAAARNEGVRGIDTELVAFLDSDTIPPPGWVDALSGHFADPLVVAVAPRVKALAGRRSPLDMGAASAEVGPGRAVSYVPSAALVVRRSALGDDPFDPTLRYGEDVDLVWRLKSAGGHIRYDPRVVVEHEETHRLARRFAYGTSAAPLARRHPGRLTHVVLRPWPAATIALLAARRPRPAAAAYLAQTVLLARRLAIHQVPARLAPVWTARALVATVTQFARLATPYGAGVLYGCVRARTFAPLAPHARTPRRVE